MVRKIATFHKFGNQAIERPVIVARRHPSKRLVQSHESRRFREQVAKISFSIPGPRVNGHLQREFPRQLAASAYLVHLVSGTEPARAKSGADAIIAAANRTSNNQAGS